MKPAPEPLAIIGQGDNRRTIMEDDNDVRAKPVNWLALVSLWLSFAVLAWLWDLASRH